MQHLTIHEHHYGKTLKFGASILPPKVSNREGI